VIAPLFTRPALGKVERGMNPWDLEVYYADHNDTRSVLE
jgi:hypothetical protein